MQVFLALSYISKTRTLFFATQKCSAEKSAHRFTKTVKGIRDLNKMLYLKLKFNLHIKIRLAYPKSLCPPTTF